MSISMSIYVLPDCFCLCVYLMAVKMLSSSLKSLAAKNICQYKHGHSSELVEKIKSYKDE